MSDAGAWIAKFFRVGGKAPLFIHVDAHGNPVPSKLSSGDLRRFELRSKGRPLFWTSCCAGDSRFAFADRKLTVTYVVRNALLSGLKTLAGGSAVDALVFRLEATVVADGSLRVDALRVSRFIPGDENPNHWFPGGENLWAAPLNNAFRRSNPAPPVALLRDLSGLAQASLPTTDDQVPFTIRRVDGGGPSRVEILRGINHDADVPQRWPSFEDGRGGAETGPRFRLRQGSGHLEFLVDLAHRKATGKAEYWLVQTDPWTPPKDDAEDADAVWREFRIDGLDPKRVLSGYGRAIAAAIRDPVAIANEPDGISVVPEIAADGMPQATASIVWEQRDQRPDEPQLAGADDFGAGRSVRLTTTAAFPVRVTLPGLASDAGVIAFTGKCGMVAIGRDDRAHGFEPNAVIDLSELRIAGPGDMPASDVGAMKLDFARASGRKNFRIAYALAMHPRRRSMQRPLLHAELELGGIAVRPIGFDPAPESRFSDDLNSDALSSPIVAPAADGAFAESALIAREWLRDGHSRSLSLSLLAQSSPGDDADQHRQLDVIVLDVTPFFLGKVAVPLPLADEETGAYATWSLSDPEGPRWRFRSLDPIATLTLPTQGVGEAYERRKDIPEPTRDQPQPKDGQPPLVDYRLGPHADFKLRLRDDERAYSDLPWNLRLLFGRAGGAAPGPVLTSARFELLYGLETTLAPTGIRLTTDEVARGGIVQRFVGIDATRASAAETTAPEPYRRAWNALVDGYQSRLLPLHPYRPLAEGAACFDGGNGLSQRLRLSTTDDHREFADLDPEPYLDGRKGHGLRGGATFGFESERIYVDVTRDLRSTSGEASQLAWTALGGYGALKARFDEDRSIIEAKVELGRVSHYAVERIGRIGVFWNRAKHVIVYERTTRRAERYEEVQNELKHLPIVRKVDEYIELLEPERRFAPPDRPAQTTGFVQGLKFADRIIRVSSLWGRDVGMQGWAVPLWRKGEDPTLFPKPLVNLIAASQEAGEEALHAIADPENLMFFTDTTRGAGDDSDRWPALEDLDFVDTRVHLERTPSPFGDRSAETLRRPNTSPQALPPALAPCTWRIESGATAIDLVAGRGPRPISAKLANFTVMRRPAELPEQASPVRRARAAMGEFESIREDVRDTLAMGLRGTWPKERWDAESKRLKTRIDALLKELRAIADDGMNVLARSPCALLIAQAQRPLNVLARDAARRIDEEGDQIKRRADAIGKLAEEEIRALAHELSQRVDILAATGGQAAAHLDATLDRAEAELQRIRERAVSVVAEAEAELQVMLDDIGQTLDERAYRLRLARVRQTLRDLRTHTEPLFDELRRACARLAARWNGNVAGVDLAERLPKLVGGLDSEWKGVVDAADLRLDSADGIAEKFGETLRSAVKDLKTGIGKGRADIDKAMDALKEEALAGMGDARGHVQALSKEFDEAILGIRKGVGDFEAEVANAADLAGFKIKVDVAGSALKAKVSQACADANTAIKQRIEDTICPYLPQIDPAHAKVLLDALSTLGTLVEKFPSMDHAILASQLEAMWSALSGTIEASSDWIAHAADSLGDAVRTAFDAPLSLLRAFGAAPDLPELSFNREWLEYVFKPGDITIDLSPVTAFFSELGDDLKGLSLNLPSVGIDASGLLPAALREFDLNAVFGSLGGVKMPGLLSRVKLPNLDRNAVRITHGFDKKSKRAWVQADVDVPYDTNPVLFDAMSLTLRLVKPRFTANSRLDAALEGKPGFHAKGEIASTLRLEFSGNALVDLRDAAIRFDDRGRFDFDFNPDRIDFRAGLKFIADLIKSRKDLQKDPDKAQGFVPELIEVDGQPIGVRTTLELDPGPLNVGAFAMDGLALNLSFELVAKPEFKIGTRLGLASRDKPFVISVGLLGGGGWLTVAVSYAPAKGLLESEVDIAIAAGRVFSVAFGPIRGMAKVVFGVNARFVSRGSHSRFNLIVFFLFTGDFRLWGIVTVGVYLRLEIEYQSSGSLVGRGVVHVTVKIGRFFKRTVRQRVTYQFAGKSGSRQALVDGAAKSSPSNISSRQETALRTAVGHGERADRYLERYED